MRVAWMTAKSLVVVYCLLGAVSGCTGPSEATGLIPQGDVSNMPQLQIVQAAVTGDVEWMRALITANSALAYYQGDDRRTPLHFAAANGHNSVVKYLLDNGADPSVQDEDGLTAQSIAFQQGYVETAKLIGDFTAKQQQPAQRTP